MHKLTNDRMRWGASALLTGAAIGAVALLGALPRRAAVRHRPPVGFHRPASGSPRRRVAARKRKENTSRFAVEVRHLTPSRTRIRVYKRRSGQTTWTRTLYDVKVVRWSKDRQALAAIGTRNEDACSFVLLVWRNGVRVRTIRHIRPFDFWDAAENVIWSPDDRRLLLVGQRGMGVPCLDLSCYGLGDRRTRFVADNVTQEGWTSPTRVRFWSLDCKSVSCSSAVETQHDWDCLASEPAVPEEFRQNLRQREEVVALVRAGKLACDPFSAEIPLPARYRRLSRDGRILVQEYEGNTTLVFFACGDSCVDSCLLYEADGQPPDEPWRIVKKVAPHWFWVHAQRTRA